MIIIGALCLTYIVTVTKSRNDSTLGCEWPCKPLCVQGYDDVLELLAVYGASVNADQKNGTTALMIAAELVNIRTHHGTPGNVHRTTLC